MGLNLIGSSSSYDYKDYGTVITEIPKLPNPNPKNFKIVKSQQIHRSLVVMINYPDCTNYEGNKVLVYIDTGIAEIKLQGSNVGLDPHFSNNKKYHSPIARFEPTELGWNLAVSLSTLCKDMKR